MAMSAFAQRLIELMLEKDLGENRSALSEQTGIPYHRLNPWFIRPKAKPNAADLLVLARFFDVTESYLLSGGTRRPFNWSESLARRADRLNSNGQALLEKQLDALLETPGLLQDDQNNKPDT